MKVSLQLTKTAPAAGRAQAVMLREIDLDTALAISTALRGLPGSDVEAVIVVEKLSLQRKPRTPRAQPASLGWAGWLRGLRLPMPVALGR